MGVKTIHCFLSKKQIAGRLFSVFVIANTTKSCKHKIIIAKHFLIAMEFITKKFLIGKSVFFFSLASFWQYLIVHTIFYQDVSQYYS